MQPIQSYPVFEADQVLSNGHLNNLLNYLEQQERLTRIKLLGRGIVCGLEIQSSPSEIAISKGCGLTSQGYLIQLCDTSYSSYTNYTPPTLPNDLTFLTQCSVENRNKIPFYNQKDILELIPSDDKETEEKKPLNTLNLQDYAVVLFLEAEQIDLKNCDTQDCNDKGSKMEFVLRALLIHKKLLDPTKKTGFNSILLKRYNVPVKDLKTSEDILKGFLNITDDVTLTHMSENLVRCWDNYAIGLGLPEENPLKGLNLISFKKKFSTSSNQRIYLQYFYDFIDDLFKAYLEFRSKIREAYGECCPEEMEFPLHLTLGMAHEDTRLGKNNFYRNYFEPSPILNGQTKSVEEAAILLERLVAMVQGFMGEKLTATESIQITPNYLGSEPISLRSIPYYYDWKTINSKWYFKRSYNGNERYNLGYRAAKQVDAPEPVKNPLLYDIERYNAFRIEGHIGKNYRTALTDIIQQKNKFNLPFEVLALNAIDLSAILNGKEIKCHIEDLSSDYRVMITGIVCQLQQIMAYVGNLRPKRTTTPNLNLAAVNFTRDFYISKNLVDMQKAIKSDLLKNQPLSISNEDIIKNLALRDVEEGEKLADFVAKDVSNFIVNDKAFFDYIIKQPDLLLIFLQQLAEIVKYLLAYDLDKFDEEAYNKLWTPYSKTVASLIKEASNSENEEIKSYFSESNTGLLFKCANEKLFALKEEYLKRIEEYHAATVFSEYFKKHPGLEHKAGVPKGGTFILVYNGATDLVLTLPEINFNANFFNPNFISGLSFAASAPKATPTPGIREAFNLTDTSKKERAVDIKTASKTEFEFASELIKKLNLGDAAKNVLDALNLKDREIRDQATPIAKGTVIADFYLPYLCCSECPPIAYILPEEEPENIGPIADAGEDQTFTLGPNQPIAFTLDGTASKDEDGTIISFAWSQISGPPITLKTPNQPKASAEIKTAGEYVFELTVTDDQGASNKDSVKITIIEPENIGPVANAGRDQKLTIAPNQPISVTLDGSGSKDEDGTITAFAWTQISGSSVTLKTPNKPKTAVEFSAPGEYEFELKVTDNRGASNKDSVKISIAAPENRGPIANAGRDQKLTIVPNQPISVTLDGSGSKDEDGTITAFAWSQISGSSVTLKTPNKPKTAVEFSAPGEYEFELKVTDNRGASNKDSVKISVAAAENRGPIAEAGKDQSITLVPGQPANVTLDGSASKDEDGTITAFAWSQISGSSVTLKTPNKPKTAVEFSAPGEYEFELKVTDNQGASNKDSVKISVGAPENRGPIAEAGKDQSITLVPGQPANVTLDGSASKDEDGTIASFAWTKVSGPQVSLKTPNKPKTAAVISTAGVYVFELLVKDDKGASNKDSVTITARAAQNNPPVANAGSDISITIDNPNSPGTANLDGSKSADPENGPLTFNWRFANGPVTPTILKPNQAKTSVTGLLEGNYTFTLIVKDSAGISASDSVLVKVAAAPTDTDTRAKTCGPLSDVMNAFIKFDKTEQTTSFKKFLETFGSYSEVKEFFTSMKTIASSNLTKQTDFFAKAFGNTGLISKLMDWLEKLHQIILEFKDFRTFAFQLYQIISQLVTYIVCIQKEDYDVAKIPMEKVFDVIEAHAKSWSELRESGGFARTDIAAITKIEAGFTAASTQTRENGEATAKPKYLRKIKVLEGIL